MSKTKSKSGGVTFATVVGIIFVILKLTHNVDWKWIWVLSPFWIGLVLWVLFWIAIGLWINSINNK